MEQKKENKKYDELKEAQVKEAKIKEVAPLVKEAIKKAMNERQEKSRPLINVDSEPEFEDSKDADELKKQLEEKDKTIEELTDTLKRLQAEFENYKKRVEREKVEFAKYAHAQLISEILPVIDSFELALKNTNDKEKFADGVKMIYAQLFSMLEDQGLRPIQASGEKFDPYKHEVLMKEESEKPEGTILEEFQKGYLLHDKVLRFSKVKVSGK